MCRQQVTETQSTHRWLGQPALALSPCTEQLCWPPAGTSGDLSSGAPTSSLTDACVLLAFCDSDRIPEVILAHAVEGFSPWSGRTIVSGPVVRQHIK